MVIDQLTIDKAVDVSKNNPPETSYQYHDLGPISVQSTTRVMAFVARKPGKFVDLSVFSASLGGAVLSVGVTVNGVSVMTTTATCSVADTPVLGVFDPALLVYATGDLIVVSGNTDAGAVTMTGQLVTRPLLGLVERNAA